MRTILIDGDIVAWTIAWQPEDVARRTVNYVRKIGVELWADRIVVCLSDSSHRYFRHEIMPTYKADRSDPPMMLHESFDSLRENFVCREIPGLEADDVIGVLATHQQVAGETVCVSIDKDMLTIPGTHFNPRREPRGIVTVSERDAAFNHMWQTIVGDSSDGFPGLPGVGPKGARRILWGDPSQWWAQVVGAFKCKGRTESDALLQARVARICRACDYDIENKKVIPWTPDRLMQPVQAQAFAFV